MQGQQAFIDMARRHVVFAGGVEHAAGVGEFAHHAAAMTADFGRQHCANPQFRGNAKQQRVEAEGVGVGELRQITDAHQHWRAGVALADVAIAHQGIGKPVVDGVYRLWASARLRLTGREDLQTLCAQRQKR